jgi:proteic killer suppression protein
MIKSFKHKGLKKYYETGSKAGIQAKHAAKLKSILFNLDNAVCIDDMRIPSFKLHELTGSRKGIWSVWVNGYWRVTFKFEKGNAEIVNYEDYH